MLRNVRTCERATYANLCYTGEGDDPVSERDFLHNRPPPERGFTSPDARYAEEGDSEYK